MRVTDFIYNELGDSFISNRWNFYKTLHHPIQLTHATVQQEKFYLLSKGLSPIKYQIKRFHEIKENMTSQQIAIPNRTFQTVLNGTKVHLFYEDNFLININFLNTFQTVDIFQEFRISAGNIKNMSLKYFILSY